MANGSLATAKDVADYLNVSIKTVYGWNYLGTGPKPIKVAGRIRWRWAEVEAWLIDQQQSGGGTAA